MKLRALVPAVFPASPSRASNSSPRISENLLRVVNRRAGPPESHQKRKSAEYHRPAGADPLGRGFAPFRFHDLRFRCARPVCPLPGVFLGAHLVPTLRAAGLAFRAGESRSPGASPVYRRYTHLAKCGCACDGQQGIWLCFKHEALTGAPSHVIAPARRVLFVILHLERAANIAHFLYFQSSSPRVSDALERRAPRASLVPSRCVASPPRDREVWATQGPAASEDSVQRSFCDQRVIFKPCKSSSPQTAASPCQDDISTDLNLAQTPLAPRTRNFHPRTFVRARCCAFTFARGFPIVGVMISIVADVHVRLSSRRSPNIARVRSSARSVWRPCVCSAILHRRVHGANPQARSGKLRVQRTFRHVYTPPHLPLMARVPMLPRCDEEVVFSDNGAASSVPGPLARAPLTYPRYVWPPCITTSLVTKSRAHRRARDSLPAAALRPRPQLLQCGGPRFSRQLHPSRRLLKTFPEPVKAQDFCASATLHASS
ncbi:hypothetical protein DFH09DRAFT_1310137 [Mycena vulgaris]|nr:hypothetical protein DFH09DRAFT_1310137 [Mycena vulgaris]